MKTPCPDETTIADFMQGILPPTRSSAVERHVDRCSDCTALLAALGHVYVANADRSQSCAPPITSVTSQPPARPVTPPTMPGVLRPATPTYPSTALSERNARAATSQAAAILARNTMLQLAMWLVHVWGCLLSLPLLQETFGSPADSAHLTLQATAGPAFSGFWWELTATAYLLVWFHLGLAWTLVNTYGLVRRRRWARRTTLAYALWSLPSCIGTPFSAYALYSLMRHDVADALSPSRPEEALPT